MNLGMIIKFHRIKRGLTQEYLAYGICSISHLSKIESGSNSNKGHPDVIKVLLKKLNIDAIEETKYISWIEDKIGELNEHITYYDKVSAAGTFHLLLDKEEYISSTLLINSNSNLAGQSCYFNNTKWLISPFLVKTGLFCADNYRF